MDGLMMFLVYFQVFYYDKAKDTGQLVIVDHLVYENSFKDCYYQPLPFLTTKIIFLV